MYVKLGTLVCTIDISKQVRVPSLEADRVLSSDKVAEGRRKFEERDIHYKVIYTTQNPAALQSDIPYMVNFMAQNIYCVTRDSIKS